MNKKDIKKKIKEGLSLLFLFFVILYAYLNMFRPELAIQYLGFSSFVVETNSMKPKFHRGDIIFVTRTKKEDIEVGDIVAIKRRSSMKVAHFVADIRKEEGKTIYKTHPYGAQGKKDWDYEAIPEERVMGKFSFVLPKIGYPLLFLRSKIGLITFFLSGIIIFLLMKLEK